MPTIVPGAAQCDLGQSGAPTALLRDCTIVLVWPVTGSYSTARPNYSVKKSYRMWEGAPVSAWLPILISQGGVGVAAAVLSSRCPLSSYGVSECCYRQGVCLSEMVYYFTSRVSLANVIM